MSLEQSEKASAIAACHQAPHKDAGLFSVIRYRVCIKRSNLAIIAHLNGTREFNATIWLGQGGHHFDALQLDVAVSDY